MDKIVLSEEEVKILLPIMQYGLEAYMPEIDEDNDGNEVTKSMKLVVGEDGIMREPDIDHMQKVLQGIVDRIEVRKEQANE